MVCNFLLRLTFFFQKLAEFGILQRSSILFRVSFLRICLFPSLMAPKHFKKRPVVRNMIHLPLRNQVNQSRLLIRRLLLVIIWTWKFCGHQVNLMGCFKIWMVVLAYTRLKCTYLWKTLIHYPPFRDSTPIHTLMNRYQGCQCVAPQPQAANSYTHLHTWTIDGP